MQIFAKNQMIQYPEYIYRGKQYLICSLLEEFQQKKDHKTARQIQFDQF